MPPQMSSSFDVAAYRGLAAMAAPRQEIAVIDTALPDWEALRDGVLPTAEIVLIDGARDGLRQLAAALRGRAGIDAIHVLSHGFPGGFLLGASVLNAATLDAHAPALAAIAAALSDDADLLLYSCLTASGAGPAFLDALALATGANVAASTTLTGAAAQGGDWTLDRQVGEVGTGSVLTKAAMLRYQHTLGASYPVYSSAVGYTGEQFFTLSFDSAPDSAHPPTPSSFSVQINGTGVTVSSVAVDSNADTVAVYFTANALTPGDIIAFTYTDPTDSDDFNAIQSLSGEDSPDFTNSTTVYGARPSNTTTTTPSNTNSNSNTSTTTTPTPSNTNSNSNSNTSTTTTPTPSNTNSNSNSNTSTTTTPTPSNTNSNSNSNTSTTTTPTPSNNDPTTPSNNNPTTPSNNNPTPPVVTIALADDTGQSTSDNITSDPALTGTADANATVTLLNGSTVIGTTTANGSGQWSYTPTQFAVPDGTYTITASETNSSSLTGTAQLTATLDRSAPSVDISSDTAQLKAGQTAQITFTFSEDPGSSFTFDGNTGDVAVSGGTLGAISGTGLTRTAIFTPAANVASGTASISVPAGLYTDAAGNLGTAGPSLTLPVDTVAPFAPLGPILSYLNDTGVSNSDGITNVVTPRLTGLAEPGSTITLYDTDGTTVLGTTVTTPSGTWSLTSAALSDGLHHLTTTATDAAGNVSPPSTGQYVMIKTTVPTPSYMFIANASDSGAIGDGATNDATPAIIGVGEEGDTVTLFDGTTPIGTGVVSGGVYSITPTTPLSDGVHQLNATETDVAGNVSGASTIYVLIDTVAPAAPGDLALAPSSDSGALGDWVTNDAMPAITGTGEDGTTVTLYDGEAVMGTATVSGGVWSITPIEPLSDGVHTLSAQQTDVSGNVSGTSTTELTVDTTVAAPDNIAIAPSSDSGALGDGLTNDATPTMTGTGENGATVTLYDGMSVMGTAVVADGVWSITPTDPLSDGLHTINAQQTDVAGNISGVATTYMLIDTSTPAPSDMAIAAFGDSGTLGDGVTNDTSPPITGGGEEGAVVTLYDGDTPIGSGVVSGGVWTITPGDPLSEGVHTLLAVETDPAGNVSDPSSIDVTIDTTAPAAPTLFANQVSTLSATPTFTGVAEPGAHITVYDGDTVIGVPVADQDGNWVLVPEGSLLSGDHTVTATQADAAGNVSGASAPLDVSVSDDSSYTVTFANTYGGTTLETYDGNSVISDVTYKDSNGKPLSGANNTIAGLAIYDDVGNMIGTVIQPSTSPFDRPDFWTLPQSGAAYTESTTAGSQFSLTAETNVLTTKGPDVVNANGEAAVVFAQGPTTTVNAGSGTLTVVGGEGAVSVTGGTGSSTVFGGAGGGRLEGGSAGNNVLVSGGGDTTLVGGGAGDILVAGSGTTTITMQASSTAFGGSGDTTFYGAEGAVMVGGSGTETMAAGDGPETMFAGTGDSMIFGGTGNDTMVGGASGSTTISGGSGDNVVIGGAGTTTAYGGTGNDVFFAGSGAMTIVEGDGADNVVFGTGNASVTGGAGRDLYSVINGQAGGADVIANFKVGTDQIMLFGYDTSQMQVASGGAGTMIKLQDGTSISLVGVSSLAPTSIV